jgi:hypothetical protein
MHISEWLEEKDAMMCTVKVELAAVAKMQHSVLDITFHSDSDPR